MGWEREAEGEVASSGVTSAHPRTSARRGTLEGRRTSGGGRRTKSRPHSRSRAGFLFAPKCQALSQIFHGLFLAGTCSPASSPGTQRVKSFTATASKLTRSRPFPFRVWVVTGQGTGGENGQTAEHEV